MNRMYQYYANAKVCYVYLVDVDGLDDFVSSRWHRRGWTLQELIAPKELQFYNKNGRLLGDRTTLRSEILQACGIDVSQGLHEISFPERFRWSLQRETTKGEDASYCMLGLLEVYMVVNYGIGIEAAREKMLRLVEREHGGRTVRQMRAMLRVPDATDQRGMDLLSRLQYHGMGSRRANVSMPLDGTCDWLLRHPDYKRWSTNGGFFWIKGKPGAGKSTLIRFADSQCDEQVALRLTHYFNARGAHIEKTVEGLYRALLCQLLLSGKTLQARVCQYWTTLNTHSLQQWSAPELQRLLVYAVQQLSTRVLCYIDALDECTATELQDMIHFLLDLAKKSAVEFKICFASRYYPSVIIQGSAELRLEDQNDHDQAIADYVDARLLIEHSPAGDALRAEVVAKANKVFFWVVLVVKVLNEDTADGNMFLLRQKLAELPHELDELMTRANLATSIW
ncbi:hypothetical protein AMS68_002144 [Peltaster fructicola]|uniref:Nephrocystin 3-like N-terminal domain-containing protein n=1 Tax=Peltaster fructicola TaxID=286661 RepID=A0A6H0XPD7_9PEZI|nr:hypothetical protein AMS68_002144 [Peltaster fructicola]